MREFHLRAVPGGRGAVAQSAPPRSIHPRSALHVAAPIGVLASVPTTLARLPLIDQRGGEPRDQPEPALRGLAQNRAAVGAGFGTSKAPVSAAGRTTPGTAHTVSWESRARKGLHPWRK